MDQQIFYMKTYFKTKSLKIVLSRYRRKFNFHMFSIRCQILELIKNFEDHGTCKDCIAMGFPTICTPINCLNNQEYHEGSTVSQPESVQILVL